jgi:hypothetical protein
MKSWNFFQGTATVNFNDSIILFRISTNILLINLDTTNQLYLSLSGTVPDMIVDALSSIMLRDVKELSKVYLASSASTVQYRLYTW